MEDVNVPYCFQTLIEFQILLAGYSCKLFLCRYIGIKTFSFNRLGRAGVSRKERFLAKRFTDAIVIRTLWDEFWVHIHFKPLSWLLSYDDRMLPRKYLNSRCYIHLEVKQIYNVIRLWKPGNSLNHGLWDLRFPQNVVYKKSLFVAHYFW